MATRQVRYKIAARSAPDFSDEFFVECPKCHGCARLIPMGEAPPVDAADDEHPRQIQASQDPHISLNPKHLECFNCRFRRSWNPAKPSFFRALVNWFGELSLYLQVDCGGHTIWALNPTHLQYLEEQLRLYSTGQTEISSPINEWLEHQDHTEIAACLSLLRKQPAEA